MNKNTMFSNNSGGSSKMSQISKKFDRFESRSRSSSFSESTKNPPFPFSGINIAFVDMMDRERVVVPISQVKNNYLCKVYWYENGKRVYGGMALVSKVLFREDTGDNYRNIGFVPESKVFMKEPTASKKEDRNNKNEDFKKKGKRPNKMSFLDSGF